MAANVETMFYVRTVPWHGLGTRVLEAPSSREALKAAGEQAWAVGTVEAGEKGVDVC